MQMYFYFHVVLCAKSVRYYNEYLHKHFLIRLFFSQFQVELNREQSLCDSHGIMSCFLTLEKVFSLVRG